MVGHLSDHQHWQDTSQEDRWRGGKKTKWRNNIRERTDLLWSRSQTVNQGRRDHVRKSEVWQKSLNNSFYSKSSVDLQDKKKIRKTMFLWWAGLKWDEEMSQNITKYPGDRPRSCPGYSDLWHEGSELTSHRYLLCSCVEIIAFCLSCGHLGVWRHVPALTGRHRRQAGIKWACGREESWDLQSLHGGSRQTKAAIEHWFLWLPDNFQGTLKSEIHFRNQRALKRKKDLSWLQSWKRKLGGGCGE